MIAVSELDYAFARGFLMGVRGTPTVLAVGDSAIVRINTSTFNTLRLSASTAAVATTLRLGTNAQINNVEEA